MTLISSLVVLMALALLCFMACILAFGVWILKNVKYTFILLLVLHILHSLE